MGKKNFTKIEDIQRALPPRLRYDLNLGYSLQKRPYPEHARDIKVLEKLFEGAELDSADYEFTNRDLRVHMRPHGILFFHALDIQDLVLSKNNFNINSPFCVYLELECQDTIKCSDPVYAVDFKKVRIDHSIHLCIELSEIRFDEMNEFLIHIYAFQDPSLHYLIGSHVMHLYQFVKEIHGISSIRLRNELSFSVGRLTFEFAWSYGSFGYGFSNQFRNPKNGIFESVAHSLFPRIQLKTKDLCDNKVNCRIPKKLRLVNVNSLLVRKPRKNDVLKYGAAALQGKMKKNKKKEKQEERTGYEFEAKTLVFRRVKFARGTPIHVSLNLDIHQKFMEDDFNMAYGEFICLRNRRDRVCWLQKMTEGRLKDKVEYEAGEILKPHMHVDEAHRVLKIKRPLGCPPGFLEYTNPQRRKDCQPIHQSTLPMADADLQFIHEKLASAPRFSGYLNYVFGYKKPPPVDENLENFEFKINPDPPFHGNTKDSKGLWTIFACYGSCCLKLGRLIRAFWNFLFPTFEKSHDKDDELPEISLTMPSPEQSTTDFHSFCTQQQVFELKSDTEKARRRATKYTEMSRERRRSDLNLDDFEEFIFVSEQFTGEIDNSIDTIHSPYTKESQTQKNKQSKSNEIKF